ncbi:hypothetical protein [Gloeobacter morelensis]|uniref:Uncharacterized protein n=1 Tax=Gloeobacter morelensis MG652769 TaxID=2781736 RepID=A0ABY3PIE9_9CYAN|nr:hypothetical protein [Gloeobacter morelensis]UFP93312.1 hypothetical protein ISF26_16090 [Gloeobacter morelensis MG652769]
MADIEKPNATVGTTRETPAHLGRSFGGLLKKVIAVNLVAALVPMLLGAPLSASGLAGLALELAVSLIYSNSIGLPVGITLWRLGPRLSPWPFPLNLVVLLPAILAVTALGCLMAIALLVVLNP